MFRTTLSLIIIGILGFLPNHLKAQRSDIWSLRRCLEYAKESNIQLKQAELNVIASDVRLARAEASRLPSLNFGTNLGLRFGFFVDPFTNRLELQNSQTVDAGLQSQVNLFNGFSISNSIKQGQLNLASDKAALAQQEYDLALNVTLAYLQILQQAEVLESAKLQLGSTQGQRDRTAKLVRAGSLPQADLLQVESQIATEEINVINAQNLLEMAYLNLQQLLNLDPDDNFGVERLTLPDPEASFSTEPASEIYQYAEANQPGIQSADFAVQSAGLGIDIANADRLPSLGLFASVGTGWSSLRQEATGLSFSDQITGNRSGSVSLGINVPIYNRRQVKTNIELAEIQMQNSRYTADLERQRLKQTIEQAYLDLRSAFTTYNSTIKQVDALELAFINTEKQFNLGVVNSVDYLLAKNNLNRARFDLVRTKYTYIFQQKVLDFYQGKPIGF